MSTNAPENPYLLAHLEGEEPPCTPWVEAQLVHEPERCTFESGGTAIELLTWGEPGAPGVLLLHGMGAHADWWRFTAPALATDHRVAAISWPGMGRSDWRSDYTLPQLARDVLAAIDVAGLDAGASRPVLAGHSFGGLPLLQTAFEHPDRICGGIMIDSFIAHANHRPGQWAAGREAMPVYPSVAAALARYRFAPVQDSQHLDIVDYIARHSLRTVEDGWTWCFDPNFWSKLDRTGADALLDKVTAPIGLLYGERSALVASETVQEMKSRLANCPIAAAIPDAAHHVMVDQPVALVAALRVAIGALQGPA
ncbi:MAG: alpha/beta hydrolase [Alphaproteobacteria bacterium]|nr:alpha/beta hydrolase [Alphaproteobacteria bacterium]MBU0794716.1 alpha/beta hydrolase [Alphaproteobacteria bacterium]MBU0875847.1 alpha/beta hydrolase [Alphaproteobacteria bacterium]MBU1769973.1 alpha/beta hydrolase [Alphaproteobacteria bacterium]